MDGQGASIPKGAQWHRPLQNSGVPAKEVCYGVSVLLLCRQHGSRDKNEESAYNYRICLSNDPANMHPHHQKPDNYDPARYIVLARLFKSTTEKTKPQ